MDHLHEDGIIRTRDGLHLYFCRNVPRKSKGVLVVLHSLSEHSGRYLHTAARFCEAGYGVYLFDCRGHGRSDGSRGDVLRFMDYVHDTDAVVDSVRDEHPYLPLFLLGHSMGGMVAVAYAAEHPEKLDGGITLSAAVQMPPALGFLKDGRCSRERGDERFALMDPRWTSGEDPWVEDELMLDSVTVRLAGNIWLHGTDWLAARIAKVNVPFLILHGEENSVVPPQCSQWLYDGVSSPDRTLRFYPRLGHDLLGRQESVLNDIVGWLGTHGLRSAAYAQASMDDLRRAAL